MSSIRSGRRSAQEFCGCIRVVCVYLAESTEEMLAVSRFVDSDKATADGNKNMHVYTIVSRENSE